ncbi:hypothetical protein [Vibrio crassostreae]|uniref:hypothetical protein n=1 Tax=Vibrio crassostreae TaxID=246167 RepID=UPI001B312756|nr:hypothetical protein [Vibrio crassostreae]
MASSIDRILSTLSTQAPNFNAANQLLSNSGQQINSGLNQLQQLAKDQNQLQNDNYLNQVNNNTDAALASLNSAINQAVATGGTVQDVIAAQDISQYGAAIDQEKYQAGSNNILAQTKSQMEVDSILKKEADNAAITGFKSNLQTPIDLSSPEAMQTSLNGRILEINNSSLTEPQKSALIEQEQASIIKQADTHSAMNRSMAALTKAQQDTVGTNISVRMSEGEAGFSMYKQNYPLAGDTATPAEVQQAENALIKVGVKPSEASKIVNADPAYNPPKSSGRSANEATLAYEGILADESTPAHVKEVLGDRGESFYKDVTKLFKTDNPSYNQILMMDSVYTAGDSSKTIGDNISMLEDAELPEGMTLDSEFLYQYREAIQSALKEADGNSGKFENSLQDAISGKTRFFGSDTPAVTPRPLPTGNTYTETEPTQQVPTSTTSESPDTNVDLSPLPTANMPEGQTATYQGTPVVFRNGKWEVR